MNSVVRDALSSWKTQGSDGDVFSVSSVKRAWTKARTLAGIPSVCRFHDMRHTCASRLVMAGVPLTAVQKALGHKTIQMTERYSHLSDDFMAEAMETLVEPEVGTQTARKLLRVAGGTRNPLKKWYAREDSNLRPSDSKGVRHTP